MTDRGSFRAVVDPNRAERDPYRKCAAEWLKEGDPLPVIGLKSVPSMEMAKKASDFYPK
jgi:hypothetical protein